jgi:short-subunit dehydrogenase
MLAELSGSRALVTGASGGIGEVIARALHAEGASLVLSARRADQLDRVAADLGERVETVPADLADAADVARLAELCKGVDVLVANAALPASGELDSFTPEQIDRALDVNLRAPIHLARAAAPEMVRRGAGHLVFISSMSGKVTTPGQSLYAATKYGMRGFSLSLGGDLHGSGVGVTTVFPGLVSGAGMFADTGLDVPRGAGTRTPEQVADAVLRGIRTGRAEIDVAPLFERVGGRLSGMSPALVAAIGRRLGTGAVAAKFAERQAEKR